MITTAQVSYKKKFSLQLAVHVLTPLLPLARKATHPRYNTNDKMLKWPFPAQKAILDD